MVLPHSPHKLTHSSPTLLNSSFPCAAHALPCAIHAGDGDLDVVIGNKNIEGTDAMVPNELYMNDGSGGLTEHTSTTLTVDSTSKYPRMFLIADYDSDGCGNLARSAPCVRLCLAPLQLFTSSQPQIISVLSSRRDMDIFVAHYGQVNELHVNDGSGVFTIVTTPWATKTTTSSFCAEWGDYVRSHLKTQSMSGDHSRARLRVRPSRLSDARLTCCLAAVPCALSFHRTATADSILSSATMRHRSTSCTITPGAAPSSS